MSETITYSAGVQITDGPSLLKSAILTLEAYDVINACIEKTTGPIAINIQPSAVPGDVVLLFITSDSYADLTFTAGGAPITLDKPQLYLGGQVALLITTTILTFTNASVTTDANIRIICGRLAETPGA